MCRSHNAYLAERDYGKEAMKRYRRSGGRVSEPTVAYFARRLERRAVSIHRAVDMPS